MQFFFKHIFVILACIAPLSLKAAQTVSVTGAVEHPGELAWQPGARLLNASIAAQVNSDAWYQGAVLQRKSAVQDQQKLKIGVLFDLQSAVINARAINAADTEKLLSRWLQRVQNMRVTGRIAAEMNPLKQRLISSNSLLEPGDQLIYPRRPTTVRIVGAVSRDCILPFTPARDPVDYLAECPIHKSADSNYLFLIQPDGKVQSVGAAYWNSEDAWIAVGATIYVPFNPNLFGTSSADFNIEMATWLATQGPQGGDLGE